MPIFSAQKGRLFSALLLLYPLLLTGCADPTPLPGNQPVATTCPLETDAGLSIQAHLPRLFLILIEGDRGYQEYRTRDISLIETTLSQVVQPGDRIVMATMELTAMNTTIFFDEVVDPVPTPNIIPSPTLEPSITPTTPPVNTPFGPYAQYVANNANATETAIMATATQQTNDFRCAFSNWYNQKQQVLNTYDTLSQKAIDSFSTKEAISFQQNGGNLNTKPAPNSTYAGLAFASSFFQQQGNCSKGQSVCNLTLLMFSNTPDYKYNSPGSLPIDLSEADIYIVFQDCIYVFSNDECDTRRVFWEDFFKEHNAHSVKVFGNKNIEPTFISSLQH